MRNDHPSLAVETAARWPSVRKDQVRYELPASQQQLNLLTLFLRLASLMPWTEGEYRHFKPDIGAPSLC